MCPRSSGMPDWLSLRTDCFSNSSDGRGASTVKLTGNFSPVFQQEPRRFRGCRLSRALPGLAASSVVSGYQAKLFSVRPLFLSRRVVHAVQLDRIHVSQAATQ